MAMSTTLVFRILHLLVALCAVIVCVVLVLANEGHPPGIVFIPIVIVYWVITHIVLLGLKWFLTIMARLKKGSNSQGWPPILTLLSIIGGLILIYVIYGLFHDFVLRSYSTEFKDIIWVPMLFLAPALLFGGLVFGAITGAKYAHWIAAAGPIAFMGYSLFHIVNGTAKPSLLNVIIVFGICIALSSYLLFSSRVKAFFASRS